MNLGSFKVQLTSMAGKWVLAVSWKLSQGPEFPFMGGSSWRPGLPPGMAAGFQEQASQKNQEETLWPLMKTPRMSLPHFLGSHKPCLL